jgi:hypothetical protein
VFHERSVCLLTLTVDRLQQAKRTRGSRRVPAVANQAKGETNRNGTLRFANLLDRRFHASSFDVWPDGVHRDTYGQGWFIDVLDRVTGPWDMEEFVPDQRRYKDTLPLPRNDMPLF